MDIFLDRYARKDASGKTIETEPSQMWERVAAFMADSQAEFEDFLSVLTNFHFVPGGRILSGAGAEKGKTFYNCYVIPVETSARRFNRQNDTASVYDEDLNRSYVIDREDRGNDSREAIFDTIGTMVGIMSRGGGVGINWSVLRPKGTYLTRVSGTTSGPVSWMDVASRAVGVVEQGGTRRGAAMFMLDDWHPDIEEFVDAKRDNSLITNANVSVAVSDEFMAKVREDGLWELEFPDTTDMAYDTDWDGDIGAWKRAGKRVIVHRTVRARELWRKLTDAAHASGEPGVVFLGRYNSLSTAGTTERIICVNPCGEQGLGAYSVCNLGALNLDSYVADGDFDWNRFEYDVRVSINFLDNVIDKDMYFVEETREQQRRLRRIGLGVMGLADALIRLRIRYGDGRSTAFVERVFRTMKDNAIMESMSLAEEKGPASDWKDSMWERPYLAEFLARNPDIKPAPLRNLFLLTQAPTGTTSLLAGVNSGIEPYFNLKTFRKDRTGSRFVYAKAVEETIPDTSVLPSYVVTSQQVSVDEHIAVQATAQRYIDSSVSKTINAPKDQTPEETAKAYMLAYDSGLKGLAYYRDGSRDIQVLYHEDPEVKIAALEQKIADLEAKIASPWAASFGTGKTTSVDSKAMMVYNTSSRCLDCGGDIVFEEGCKKCHSCGWSAC